MVTQYLLKKWKGLFVVVNTTVVLDEIVPIWHLGLKIKQWTEFCVNQISYDIQFLIPTSFKGSAKHKEI